MALQNWLGNHNIIFERERSNEKNLPGFGLGKVSVIGGVSLSSGAVNSWDWGDAVSSNVSIVGGLQGGRILGANGGKDLVCSFDSSGLLALLLGERVSTRVVKDEGVLLGGNGTEVSAGNSSLQVSNASSVNDLSLKLGGTTNSTIGRGNLWDSSESNTGGGNLSEGSTTINGLQRSGGAL